MEWVSVKEKLPTAIELVLVYMDGISIDSRESMFLARILNGEWLQDNLDDWHDPKKITHWMKLPKVPNDE